MQSEMPIVLTDSSPLDYIDALFDNLPCNAKSYDIALKKLAERVNTDFPTDNGLQLPSLNVKRNLKPYSLVRFRCMIQDMKEPEILPGPIKRESVTTHCFFRDYVNWPAGFEHSANLAYITRQVFVCVPVPFESDWVKQMWHELEDNSWHDDNNSHGFGEASQKRCKRDIEEAEINEPPLDSSKKRQNTDKISTNEEALVLPDEGCVVKVYTDGEAYKLNECFEFIGVWNRTEIESKVFCSLHAICARRLPHLHPKILPNVKDSETHCAPLGDLTNRVKLIDHFQSILCDDCLAADYLLCLLVSTIIHKDVSCIGKCSLNLYNISENESSVFATRVVNSLKNLFSKVQYLPLSLDLLKKERFVPYKDYERNVLCSGRLQLAPGTLLIIDETKLQAGHLNERGVKNIAALKTLILHQRVDYDFVYHSLEFKSDIAVLILSEGPSCLPSDFALPICKMKDNDITTVQDLDALTLNHCRSYLIRSRRTDLEISEQIQNRIQNDFVEMRRLDNSVSDLNLHRLLVLSRWIMCSFGCTTLSEEHWERARCLEGERFKRMKH